MSTSVSPSAGTPAPTPEQPAKRGRKGTKVAKFRYEAETLDGERVKGIVEAPTASAARNELAVQGLRVHRLVERKGLNVEITKEKVPLVDIMHFSRQMATFLRAGVPMTEALDNLRMDAKNKRFKEVLGDVLDRVIGGRSVTEALNLHADIFPTYFMALLGAA